MGDLAQRLVHDEGRGEVRDGPRRYLLMRADVFCDALARLPAGHQPAVLAAFADAVADRGADSVRAYLDALAGDHQALLAMMPAAAADLGWGEWRFEPVGEAPASIRLTVSNSPFTAAFTDVAPTRVATDSMCAPISGMLTAIGRAWWGGQVRCAEHRCRARDGGTSCRFEVHPIAGEALHAQALDAHGTPITP